MFHLYNSIIIVFEEITNASTTIYAPKMTWFFCFWEVFLIATNSSISLLHPAMAFIKVGPKSEIPKSFFLSSFKIVTMSLLWIFFVYFFQTYISLISHVKLFNDNWNGIAFKPEIVIFSFTFLSFSRRTSIPAWI